MTGTRTDRDLRIDFLRGICLFIIYTRHIRPNVVRNYMPSEIGFSDAAEAFIFLSGLVCGRVYANALQRGILFCQLKALRRCGQIYVAHIFTLFLNLALMLCIFGSYDDRASMFLQDPSWGLRHIFLLSFFPYSESILVVYLLLLAPLPSMLWLAGKVTYCGMVFFSFLIYFAVQTFPGALDLPADWSAIDFNPFAWQFLFFVAVALGNITSSFQHWLPRGKATIGCVLASLALLFYLKFCYASVENPWLVKFDSLPWGKADLEPLRLIHFALIAYLIWAVVPQSWPWYQGRIASAIIRCGQYSLPVFCFGVCLTNLAEGTLRTCGTSISREIAANVVGWTLLLLFGSLLHGVNCILSINCSKGNASSSQ
jgi:hypothetical protein